MFTLLPSLYLVAVHYIRKWNSSNYNYEEKHEEEIKTFDNNVINQNNLQTISNDIKSIDTIEKYDVTLLQHNDESLVGDHSQSTRLNVKDTGNHLSNVKKDEDDQFNEIQPDTIKPNQSSSWLNNERQKTNANDLDENDISYLINETGFTREQILLWYSDFLVCN